MTKEWGICPSDGHMDCASGVYLQNMTGKDIAERLKVNDILLVPIGSTENHGSGQCFGEDTFLVTRMAEAIAQDKGCTVAQPLWYGSHPWHHLGMPGTVVIPEDIFVAYIRAMIAGFWNMGFRKQIFLNGHGQEYVIPTALHQFAKTYQVPSVLAFVNWPTVIADHMKCKADGGPYETKFRHADEVEASFSLALFPEMNKQEDMEDSEVKEGFASDYVDKGGDIYQSPIPGHAQVGLGGGLELITYPEGVIGKPSLASAKKAKEGLNELLNFLARLHDDILSNYPPGKLPPADKMSQRSKEEIDDVLKGPLKGGKHIYTIQYPP